MRKNFPVKVKKIKKAILKQLLPRKSRAAKPSTQLELPFSKMKRKKSPNEIFPRPATKQNPKQAIKATWAAKNPST